MSCLTGLAAMAQAPSGVNLNIKTTISNSRPALNDAVSYTVVVTNTGTTTATNVVVKDSIPAPGLSGVTFTAPAGSNFASGTWSIGSVAPGASTALIVRGTVIGRGVFFSIAEIMSMSQTDDNSIPGNGNILEDDYSNACFSVPLLLYPADEYTVKPVLGSGTTVWYRNGVVISAGTVPTDSASVAVDGTLTIKSTGIYSFSSTLSGCAAGNCCNVEVIPGPYGSLGDYVWIDTNRNGKQDDGNTGLNGVKVYLYDAAGTKLDSTLTATRAGNAGFYTFNKLVDGQYKVKFSLPDSLLFSTSNAAGVTDDLNSDAGPDGFTKVYTIDTSLPVGNIGRDNPTVDAGLVKKTASVGDFVFLDLNKDGIQTPGEPGVPGVKVTLYSVPTSGSATPVGSLTTDSMGKYLFTGLNPGNYYVVFDTTSFPAGTVLTTPLSGTDKALDSNAGKGGVTPTFSLSAGQTDLTIDAGIVPLGASLGDFVWYDNNKDGQQSPGEPGVPGVKVTLFTGTPGSATTTSVGSLTTNSAGKYLFTGLQPGSYYVVFDTTTLPQGYKLTVAKVGSDATNSDAGKGGVTGVYSLSAGEVNLTIDAGIVPLGASVGDFVFNDINKDGQQSPGEPGVPGVKVTLYSVPTSGNATPVASLTTDSNGKYLFTGLNPGNYYVVFDTTSFPAGTVLTTPLSGTDKALDSNAGKVGVTPTFSLAGKGGVTPTFSLSAGETNLTIDAGIVPQGASVGDFVFNDTNNDGKQTPGEPGVPGVKVTLYLVPAVGSATPVGSLTTDSNGKYLFTGLNPGNYYVVFDTTSFPTGTVLTTPFSGTDKALDSNAGKGGVTPTFSLSAGQIDLTIDAGIRNKCATPIDLTITSSMTICAMNSTALIGTTLTGSLIRWYQTMTGVDTLATRKSGQVFIVSPAMTTIYYADAISADGCVSVRKAVTVTVTPIPSAPTLIMTGGSSTTVCLDKTVDLTKMLGSLSNAQNVFVWYTTQERTGSPITNPTAVGPGKYYAFERTPNGCISNGTVITINGIDCNTCTNIATVNVSPAQPVCAGDTIRIAATVGGSASSLTWSSKTGGTFGNLTASSTYYVPSATDIAKGSVELTATTNDPDGPCTPGTGSVLVTINVRPGAPTGVACDDTLICQGTMTKLIGFAAEAGAKINWYAGNSRTPFATTVSGGKVPVTPSATTTYYAEAVGPQGCVGKTRTPVTVTVQQCYADLGVVKTVLTAGPYTPGKRITYGITASNVGPRNATAVTVKDVLPASLTFVSATPAGVYDPSTGVWTIGALNAGSDRTLLMDVIVGAGDSNGNITNTAIIAGPDNDPKRTQNDTSRVTIKVEACRLLAPHITCAITEICLGDKTTLKAENCMGNIVWSDGQIGATVDVRPSATMTYSASCVVGGCISPASNPITVTVRNPLRPTVTASAGTVCPGGSVTLTASGCNGQIQWSDPSLTGASVVVSPLTRTTYTAICKEGTCLSIPAVVTIEVGADLPKPTISVSTSVVCPNETATLTINNCLGTPTWSTGDHTTSITVRPTANTTYSVLCVNGTCTSPRSDEVTIQVVAPAVPTVTVSSTQICAGASVTLTASGCDGSVIWSNTQKTGNWIVVNPTVSTTYQAFCKVRNCTGDGSAPVRVNVVAPAAPLVATSKALVCSGESVTLTATGCESGTVVWSNGLMGSSVIFMPTATADYSAVCQIGACKSDKSNTFRITVNTAAGAVPLITASKNYLCAGESITLSATGCAGTLLWSDGQQGASITVSPTATTEYYAICKLSANQCGSGRSNTVKINVTNLPKPRVTCSTDSICPGETVTLTIRDCLGTPKWSTGETTTSIIVAPTQTTSYSVICKSGTCVSPNSDLYTIKVTKALSPTIVASATEIDPGQSVTLTAQGCDIGTISWSNGDSGRTIVVTPNGTQSYYAQCKYRECLSLPSVTITIKQKRSCLAKAGSLLPVRPEVCSSSDSTQVIEATLNGGLSIPTGYSVIYVLTKGTDLVIQQVGAAPKFTVAGGLNDTYTIHTLVYDGRPTSANYLDLSVVKPGTTTGADVVNLITTKHLCADLDVAGAKTRFRYVPQPSVASSATSVCAGSSVTLTVANCAGSVQWSTGDKGASIVTPIFKNTWISATCTVDGCTSSPSKGVNIAVVEPQIPLVSTDTPTICLGAQVTLKATGCENGTIIWSTGQTGSSILVTPTATNNQFRAKCRYMGCESDFSPISTITIGNPGAPTISVVGSTTGVTSATVCYGSSITLQAEGCPAGSYVIWSNNEVGNQLTVTPAAAANYTARCCLSNNCKSEPSNSVALTVLPKVPNPTVTDRTNTCPFSTVDLTSAITSQPATTGGVFEFYTSNTPSAAAKVANPNAVGAGTYYVFKKSTSGCYSLPSKVSVQIISCGPQNPCDVNPATASAGADDKICASKAYRLNGVVGGGAVSSRWTTDGSGTFDNAYLPNATYTAGASDIGKTITMTLTAETGNKDCPKVVSTMKLTVDGVTAIPVAKAIGSTFACFGDSVTLEAKAAPQGTTYRWSNGATTQRITVATSGTYTVQYANAGLCLSLPSNAVSVSIAAPTPMPVVRNLRNTCPATTVNLMDALAGSPTMPGTHYEFHISPSCAAGWVLRPDSVGEGIYYVGARGANGCASVGAKVVVSIFDCKTDTARVDLSVAKLANKTNVSQGETITYSLIVKNNGTSTATNVDMRDILPAGLELVAKPNPDYTLTNGVITVHYDSLAVGATDTTTFQARLTRKGQVVNKVELVYADQVDPNLANNTATVMVQDTSAALSSGKVVVAKSVLNMPEMLTDSTFRVTYAFNMTNFGQQDATVRLSDNLLSVFAQHTIQATSVTVENPSTLHANASYNGSTNAQLLDSKSVVKAGASQRFFLAVTVKLNPNDTTRTFANSAMSTVISGTATTVTATINGTDPNPNAQPAPTVFHLTPQGKQAQIGAALAVTDLTKLPDGSFNVTYQLILGNAGTAGLKGVTAVTSLSTTFPSPVSFSLTGAPVGTGLVANPNFDGVNDLNLLSPTSTLPVGGTAAVTYTVNVMTGDNKGPFYSSVTAFAYSDQDSTQTTEDVSNTGFNPNPVGSKKTVVRFDLPDALVGVAKSVDKAVAVSEGRFDVTYTLRLTNYGLADLKHVQLEDNLTRTFEPKAMIVGKVTVTADSGLVVNSQYTGQGMLTQLLDTTSTLPKGKTRSVKLTVRVQLTNAGTDTTRTFYNTAIVSASSLSGMGASATSVSGNSSDPNNTGDPRGNSSPTPVVLNSLPAGSHIGVAMAVSDTTRMTDGSYKVTYKVVVKNYGVVNLRNISLSDSLAKVFNAQTGASFRMMGTPAVAAGSSLSPNPAFDGSTVTSLLLPASSSLAAGKADTLTFTLNVATDGRGATYLNSVYARATANADTLRDVSTNGLNPDLNANGNPSDANESEATPLTLPATNLNVFIPQGFSPNGDGINDLFVIRGTNGLTVDLEVYNRWGNLVYKNADYKNDWDGRSNTNLNIGTSQGLPEGTYFYVVRLSNGMEYVRYLTINR